MLYFSAMERIRNFQTTICLVLVLLTIGIEGWWSRTKTSTRATRALQKIKTTLRSAGRDVGERVDKISAYLDSEGGSSQMDAISSSLETIGEAVPSLTSVDTVEIVSGTLDVISAASDLIPVAGPIISTVFSLIGTIFGAVAGGGGATEDVGTVVRKEIEKALNKYDDSQLKAEADGAMRVYRISHAYLARKEGEAKIREYEIAALSAHVPVYQGIKFLGILGRKVKDYSKGSYSVQVKRAMEYMQLYVTLAIMRYSILWELYALVKTSPGMNFTAEAIHRVIIEEDDHDKSILNFMHGLPDYPQAVFFAIFDPSEWPITITFMKKKGLNYVYQGFSYLAYRHRYLMPEKGRFKYMYMKNDPWGNTRGRNDLHAQGLFYFDLKPGENNVFYIRSFKWSKWYLYMKDEEKGGCRGKGRKPGPEGEWIVVKFKDGRFMLSTKAWPNKYMYMKDDSNGNIRGWIGDPGKQGHWTIS